MELNIVDMRGSLPVHSNTKYTERPKPFTCVVLHHSLTTTGSAELFADYHVHHNGWPGLAYAYVILKDGTVEWGWDTNIRTYHVGKYNTIALGICSIGDFRGDNYPTPAQWNAAHQLIEKVASHIPPGSILGHSEVPTYAWKSCPGDNWNMAKFRREIKNARSTT